MSQYRFQVSFLGMSEFLDGPNWFGLLCSPLLSEKYIQKTAVNQFPCLLGRVLKGTHEEVSTGGIESDL